MKDIREEIDINLEIMSKNRNKLFDNPDSMIEDELKSNNLLASYHFDDDDILYDSRLYGSYRDISYKIIYNHFYSIKYIEEAKLYLSKIFLLESRLLYCIGLKRGNKENLYFFELKKREYEKDKVLLFDIELNPIIRYNIENELFENIKKKILDLSNDVDKLKKEEIFKENIFESVEPYYIYSK